MSVTKMSFLFPPCQNTLVTYLRKVTALAAGEMNSRRACEPEFHQQVPLVALQLNHPTSGKLKVNKLPRSLQVSWLEDDKFKPAHFHLICVKTNILPAIFPKAKYPIRNI